MTDVRIYIGNLIASKREERGLKQSELAEKTGLKQQHISRIENGRYSTGIDILGRIAEALGCNIIFVDKE